MTATSFPARRSGWTTPDYDQLRAIDWSFRDANTRGGPHAIHPYPAKFIPQIPEALIAALHPGDDTAVLDPFCGSGTTLVEAALAGKTAIGIDLHPLACLISKVKVTPLARSLTEAATSVVEMAKDLSHKLPNIPALDHWFDREIQQALSAFVAAINAESDLDIRDAMRVALSSIIVRVSRQESDTRYAAIEKGLSATDVKSGFLRSAATIEGALAKSWNGTPNAKNVRIIHKDILTVGHSDVQQPVSLVVTSPPYPNAYEYWLYHKYRMYWLGMDPIAVRTSEIGARPHYHKTNPQSARDFEEQMVTVFRLLRSVIVRGGHACFQIGSSVIRGELVDNAAIFERVAANSGFVLAIALDRTIPNHRKSFNLNHARIKQERILIFRREGT